MRDSQRSRVYSAEGKVFLDPFYRDDLKTVQSCQDYVDSITKTAWWRHRSRLLHVTVEHGARGGRAWATYGSIRTSPGSRKKWVMLHELAHILTDSHANDLAPHGPEFCANYVALTRQFLGKETGDYLRQSFRDGRVKVRGVRKPKVVQVQCSKCAGRFAYGTGWRLKHSSIGATQFCTKRCGVEWFAARLTKVG